MYVNFESYFVYVCIIYNFFLISYFLFSVAKSVHLPEFNSFLNILQEEATTKGLDDDVLSKLANVIIHTDLR